MPMTRRQLHQTEIDYQDFLPADAKVIGVKEIHTDYDSDDCELCGVKGNRKKGIEHIIPEKPGAVVGRWKWACLFVCRNGRGCRGRCYDAKLK